MRVSNSFWLFCFSQLLFIQNIHAQGISGGYTFAINDQLEERIYAIDQLEFYEDVSDSLEFNDIIQSTFQERFKVNPDFSKGNFSTDHSYWVKVSILKQPQSDKHWILEFYDQTIDNIEAYLPGPAGFRKIQLGDQKPFKNRLFAHKNFEIPVGNNSAGVDNYYFKIKSSQKADIRIAFRSVNRFVFYALNEYFLYGIFYGMILIITLYNLLIYGAIREVKYLYYVFYLLGVAGFALALDGVGFQYFWPDNPSWNGYATGVFAFSILSFAILFSVKFLNLKHRHQLFYRVLMGFLMIRSLIFLAGLWFFPRLLDIQVYDMIPFSLILIASIQVLIKGYKVARLFVAAYAILFIGLVLKVLVQTAVIPHSTILYYSLHIAFLIEMLLLTLALGDRVKILKDTKDRALRRSLRQSETNAKLKDKINQELEQKVAERTYELESKNSLLEEYNRKILEKDEKIKRFNALLDKDIWKLKSQVRESMQARITNKRMNFTEFKVIFPDAAACLRYLYEMKWGKGYSCRSCGHHRESKSPKLFSKRCGRCGHTESPTSGTVFHGIRIPLEKAFFIAYLVISDQDNFTLDQLSNFLDLRVNAISSFRIKVRQVLDNPGKSSPIWEELLMEQKHEGILEPN
jgi:hypothetical protein